MKTIKKVIIPAAGLGTRFLPLTKSMPKEMLPIIDKPVIHYVVEEAISSGIDDIIIITGRGKRSIEDYFDHSPELEFYLKEQKKEKMLKIVNDISSLADIHYIRQKEPLGLGDAILRAEKHIDGEPFGVLLGDDIFKGSQPCLKQLIEIFEKFHCSVVGVEEVPREKIPHYGIIQGTSIEDNIIVLETIIEKPALEDAPSNIGVVGRYIFEPEIFDCIRKTRQGVGNEIQLTDGIKLLMETRKILAFKFAGKRYDTGDKIGYLKAIIDFSIEDPQIGKNIHEILNGLDQCT